MNRSSTAREALAVELFEDVDDLVKQVQLLTTRVESLTTEVQVLPATIDQAREKMWTAVGVLDSRIEPFRHYLAAEVEKTKDIAVRAFIERTNRISAEEQINQSYSMLLSARAVFSQELEPRFQRFSETLQRLVDEADRPPLQAWLLRGATVGISALCSGLLVLYFFGR